MKIQYKKGFTLVEIMIVVAIIGIIIAIAVPAFLRAREQSRGTACQENLAKIDGAVEQYALENKLGQGESVTVSDLVGVTGYLKKDPECPAGGAYDTEVSIGTDPTCDYSAGAFGWMHSATPVKPGAADGGGADGGAPDPAP